MQALLDSFLNYWYIWLAALPLLPYILTPILPTHFKTKAVMELDCDVQKAYDTITTDPTKCQVGGSLTTALQVGVADKDGKPTEWKEDLGRGEVITIKRDMGVKPGKSARLSQTMESEMSNIEAKWEYAIEPAESGRCRITLDGHLEVRRGKWSGPIFRMMVFLNSGGKKGMIEHLNLIADVSGAKRKWIA